MSLRKIIFIIIAALIIPFSLTTNASRSHRKSTRRTAIHKRYRKAATRRTAKILKEEKAEEEKEDKTNTKATLATNIGDVSGETIVKTAMKYIGVPYRRGTSSPSSFDCSGFTSYVYKQFDIALARQSGSQFIQGETIKDKSNLHVGDLVFFKGSSCRGGIGHVGIVTEVNPNDKTFSFVHASNRRGVTVDNSKMAYFSKRYVGACRVLPNGLSK